MAESLRSTLDLDEEFFGIVNDVELGDGELSTAKAVEGGDAFGNALGLKIVENVSGAPQVSVTDCEASQRCGEKCFTCEACSRCACGG